MYKTNFKWKATKYNTNGLNYFRCGFCFFCRSMSSLLISLSLSVSLSYVHFASLFIAQMHTQKKTRALTTQPPCLHPYQRPLRDHHWPPPPPPPALTIMKYEKQMQKEANDDTNLPNSQERKPFVTCISLFLALISLHYIFKHTNPPNTHTHAYTQKYILTKP